ncbi:MAG TPA: hypothetical protein VNU01_11450 [Egibacteraceae bacterium]|nr:hypothetical protein [Egibacteraceae bacterium]
MRSRGPLLVILAVGVGLAAAPMVFQMFTRAPLGGQMIEEFRPFMSPARLDAFEGHLTRIGAAVESLHRRGAGLEHPLVEPLATQWPEIDADMTGMLDDIRDNLDNFAAVAALPPFPLFPWFFLAPGLLLAWGAGAGLRRADHDGLPASTRAVLVALGLGLVAAPAVFQMFERAPLGGDMIADFRSLMTEERIQSVQGYFLVIGAAEGALRTEVLEELEADGMRAVDVRNLVDAWPAMAADMAPMIGAMSDNLDNYRAVAALPPFGLFPWFFVIPGLLVAGLALLPPGTATAQKETTP